MRGHVVKRIDHDTAVSVMTHFFMKDVWCSWMLYADSSNDEENGWYMVNPFFRKASDSEERLLMKARMEKAERDSRNMQKVAQERKKLEALVRIRRALVDRAESKGMSVTIASLIK